MASGPERRVQGTGQGASIGIGAVPGVTVSVGGSTASHPRERSPCRSRLSRSGGGSFEMSDTERGGQRPGSGLRLYVVPGTRPWAGINLFDDPLWQDTAGNGRCGMAVAALVLDALVVLALVTISVLFVVALVEYGHAFTKLWNGLSHFHFRLPPNGGP
jgi:hypothetical protein